MEDVRENVAPRRSGPTPILWPSLKVGAFTGATGAVVGATAGVIRTSTPALFATASGIQCFALGSTYWAFRTAVIDAWDTGNINAADRRNASAIAGGISGAAVGAFTRGPRNILPGLVIMSGAGFFGQSAYNILDARNSETMENPQPPKEKLWVRAMKSRWSPMSVLTDEEYEKMLKEKMLKLDVEIALVNDRIESLKEQAEGYRQAQVTNHNDVDK